MTDANAIVQAHLTELEDVTRAVAVELKDGIVTYARHLITSVQAGHKILFCGNGGSAADAQHLATEYVVRFQRERRAIAALALTTDTSLLTAGANDYGYDTIFARQIEALGRAGDVLVLHSTSGESENLLRAAESAHAAGIKTVALLAKGGGRLASRVDHALVVPTDSTARAQEMHLAIGHIVCDLVDRAVADSQTDPS